MKWGPSPPALPRFRRPWQTLDLADTVVGVSGDPDKSSHHCIKSTAHTSRQGSVNQPTSLNHCTTTTVNFSYSRLSHTYYIQVH